MKGFFSLSIIFSSIIVAEFKPVALDAKILKSLDGVNRIIDGNAVKIEYQVLNDIATIQFGKIDKVTKKRTGIISYNGELKSLKQLVIEETKLEQELKKEHISIKEAYHNPQLLSAALQEKVHQLYIAFHQAKDIFKEATFQFLDSIQHFKNPVLALMQDCCEKRDKPHSLILKWAEAAGDEEIVFHKYMATATEFDSFLTDLTLFLRDLIHNCPKAKKQFEEWYLKKN